MKRIRRVLRKLSRFIQVRPAETFTIFVGLIATILIRQFYVNETTAILIAVAIALTPGTVTSLVEWWKRLRLR